MTINGFMTNQMAQQYRDERAKGYDHMKQSETFADTIKNASVPFTADFMSKTDSQSEENGSLESETEREDFSFLA
jgi:hypothetical protein